ncbi:MAG: HAMP domain-containing histidine kinase [Snodgrassella sp.]|nr:HAMP domain-containing histidine kinase [Snodgrassella sp.]
MKKGIVGWQPYLDRLSALLNIARVSLLFSIMTFYVLTRDVDGLGLSVATFNKIELYSWISIYGFLILISMLVPRWQNQTDALPNVYSVVDITMIAWLMSMGGGVDSGFGILILPFVASACLFSRGRYPMVYAGYVALLITIITVLQITRMGLSYINIRICSIAIMLIVAAFLVAGLTAFVAKTLARSQNQQLIQSQLLTNYKNLLVRAFNFVQEAVVVLDEAGVVWLLNRRAQNFFPDLLVDKKTALFREIQIEWQRRKRYFFECKCTLSKWPMRVRVRMLHEANKPLLILSMRSETEIDQEAMAIKLASLGQLTANLAHEIRNPLSAIRQANGLLQEDEQNSGRLHLFNIIDNNIGRIDKMLEDISTLNKRDKIDKHCVNFKSFWSAFVHEFTIINPQAEKCIRMSMDNIHTNIWCDPVHLQQIMWNLMNNAWRHSRQDNDSIQVLARERGQDKIAIVVIDNGKGVSVENQLRLFEPFFTTESTGTGLGLYVARELAQANHGQLSYRSEINGFELILPRMLDE